jgi:hypothetical protein
MNLYKDLQTKYNKDIVLSRRKAISSSPGAYRGGTENRRLRKSLEPIRDKQNWPGDRGAALKEIEGKPCEVEGRAMQLYTLCSSTDCRRILYFTRWQLTRQRVVTMTSRTSSG